MRTSGTGSHLLLYREAFTASSLAPCQLIFDGRLACAAIANTLSGTYLLTLPLPLFYIPCLLAAHSFCNNTLPRHYRSRAANTFSSPATLAHLLSLPRLISRRARCFYRLHADTSVTPCPPPQCPACLELAITIACTLAEQLDVSRRCRRDRAARTPAENARTLTPAFLC